MRESLFFTGIIGAVVQATKDYDRVQRRFLEHEECNPLNDDGCIVENTCTPSDIGCLEIYFETLTGCELSD